MYLQPGIFLKSTDTEQASVFNDALIFVTEYDKNGAMGFVVNKPFTRNLDELEEFRHSASIPLYEGGPVDQEHLYFIHRTPKLITGGKLIINNIYLGGNFKEAIKCINNKSLHLQDIKIFVGYCGWDSNELEAELEDGSWLLDTNADAFISVAHI